MPCTSPHPHHPHPLCRRSSLRRKLCISKPGRTCPRGWTSAGKADKRSPAISLQARISSVARQEADLDGIFGSFAALRFVAVMPRLLAMERLRWGRSMKQGTSAVCIQRVHKGASLQARSIYPVSHDKIR